MIARNPKNHEDQWLVAKKYFEDNFEEIPKVNVTGNSLPSEAQAMFNRDMMG